MRKNNKILVISNMYPSEEYPSYGSFVKSFVKNLGSGDKFDVEKVIIAGKNPGFLKKVKVYLKFFLEIISRLLSVDYDLIYVHYVNHSVLPFFFLPSRYRKLLILNFHGSDVFPENLPSRLIQYFARKSIRDALRIVVPSNHYKGVVAVKFSVQPDMIFVSPSSGVDLSCFRRIRPYTGKINGKLQLGFVSRLDFGKGLETLIDAVQILVSHNSQVFVHVVGDGKQGEDFRRTIRSRALNEYFLFYGALPQKKLPPLLSNWDCFVFPSYRQGESLGLVGLEAMACQLPVIGSNIPSIAGYVKDGFNGLLFEVKDAENLAMKIFQFLNFEPGKRRAMSHNALNTVKSFEDKKIAKEMNEFLSNLLHE